MDWILHVKFAKLGKSPEQFIILQRHMARLEESTPNIHKYTW